MSLLAVDASVITGIDAWVGAAALAGNAFPQITER
jgi:hypothetical protein